MKKESDKNKFRNINKKQFYINLLSIIIIYNKL